MKDEASGLLVIFIILMIALAIGWKVTAFRWRDDANDFKTQAVIHGAAEWKTDASGATYFHWKPIP